MSREISATTALAMVIGQPIRHSLSPAIHNAAFAHHDIDWRLVACEVPVGRAGDALYAMASLGIRGAAVTMPHKESIASLVDEIDVAAQSLQSVNTVLLRDDGSTLGASTDGHGFVASLTAAGVAPRRVALVGAGAAARSIIDALGRHGGVEDIAVINRSAHAAEQAATLAQQARVATVEAVADADVLVNATPVGMGSDRTTPIDEAWLRPDLAVADIVYHPLETPLLAAARAHGAPVVDGLGMLIEQARLQQHLWTGTLPAAEPMRAAALAELRTR